MRLKFRYNAARRATDGGIMSDDSFIREVNQELRQDQARALWDRYGTFVIGIAIAVVLATAAYVGWQYWVESRANRAGDAFAQALTLANEGQHDEALAALAEIEEGGVAAYPLLAEMRSGTVLFQKGDVDAAVAAFDAVANDGSAPQALRDMARLRAALILVDNGSYADVSSRVETLTADTNPLRHSAREALGLSAWKEGRTADALALFEQIVADEAAPRGLRQRATLMAELIRGSGAAAS